MKTSTPRWAPGRKRRMKGAVLSIFLIGLTACVLTGTPILWALLLGLFCFSAYALHQGHSPRALSFMLLAGIRKITNILVIFCLIGMLTAIWRAAGTIPLIIRDTLDWVAPASFSLSVFLLCSLMSLLLGTSFGTVSTLGVIFMLLARAAGLNEGLTAGAIMSGIYVGDRCSPMSSSAALVCALTSTNIYGNIRRMWRTGAAPFVLTGLGYWLLSHEAPAVVDTGAAGRLDGWLRLDAWALLPAAVIVALSLFRVEVKRAMTCSVLAGCGVCLFVQNMPLSDLLSCLLRGYRPPEGAEMLAGGGILSMWTVAGIVLLSSSYAGIFDATGLLRGFEESIRRMADKWGAFRTTAAVSLPVSAISCHQTLATILTDQLCRSLAPTRQERALHLENSVILIAAIVPWSIACSVPCATLGVGMECLPYALYLYLVPVLNGLSRESRAPFPLPGFR